MIEIRLVKFTSPEQGLATQVGEVVRLPKGRRGLELTKVITSVVEGKEVFFKKERCPFIF